MKISSATEFVRDDHKRLLGVFRQLEAVDLRVHTLKAEVAAEALMEVEIHERILAELFYPVVRPRLDRDGQAAIVRGLEAHRFMLTLIRWLRKVKVNDRRFNLGITELRENLEIHIHDEESGILAKVEVSMPRHEFEKLASAMQSMRAELVAAPEYRRMHDELKRKISA